MTDYDSVLANFDAAGRNGLDECAAALQAHQIQWETPAELSTELLPVPEFDADTLLPEVIRDWVVDEAERMPCAQDFVGAGAIVALGAVIGSRCAIKPKSQDSWLVVPNLWGGIVGEPSAKKSPAWGAAFRPIDVLTSREIEANQEAKKAHNLARFVYEAEQDEIKARIKRAAKAPTENSLDSVVDELSAHQEREPSEPVLRRFKTNDCTVEKLGELLRDNPTGMLVMRDELVGLLASWEKEGREGDRAFFLEAWNGTHTYDTDRIGRGHIAINNVCLSIFGGIQPDKLVRYLTQAADALGNDGMLQRFQILVYPNLRRWEWRDQKPDKRARERAYAVFEHLADCDPVAWGAMPPDAAQKFPWFRFSAEAQAIFISWAEDLHRNRIPIEEATIVCQHFSKYEKLFPALALIFHLVDCATGATRGEVGEDAALRAAAWCDYLALHAKRCYGLLQDADVKAAEVLSRRLSRGDLQDGFTARDVQRRQWRGLNKKTLIADALEILEASGWVAGELTGGGGPGTGRPTTRYRINPAIRCPKRGKA